MPPDQFDAVMADWDAQVKSLEKQRDKLAGNGNAEVAAQKQQQIDAIEDARPRPMTPGYAGFARLFKEHTYAYLHRGEQLTQRFVQDIQEALK